MKTLKSIVKMVAAGGCMLVLVSCDNLVSLMGDSSGSEGNLTPLLTDSEVRKRQYPVERSLTDQQGRRIQAVITGRSAGMVAFYKVGDTRSRVYNYPIDQLSQSDQSFLSNLPIGGSLDEEVSLASQSSLRNRKAEMEEMEQEILELKKEGQRNGLTGSQASSIENEVERKQRELSRLKARYEELYEATH